LKQSLVVEVKASESDAGSDSESEPERGRRIIDAEPNATVATTKLQPCEPDEPEEGECLFHSQMWVKGTPLPFIVDSGSQKNLISASVLKTGRLEPKPAGLTGFIADRVEPVEKPNRPTGLRRNRPVYDQTGRFMNKPAGLVINRPVWS
jgi:hypothetical protein